MQPDHRHPVPSKDPQSCSFRSGSVRQRSVVYVFVRIRSKRSGRREGTNVGEKDNNLERSKRQAKNHEGAGAYITTVIQDGLLIYQRALIRRPKRSRYRHSGTPSIRNKPLRPILFGALFCSLRNGVVQCRHSAVQTRYMSGSERIGPGIDTDPRDLEILALTVLSLGRIRKNVTALAVAGGGM